VIAASVRSGCAVLLVFAGTLGAQPFPEGLSQRTLEIHGTALEVHAYKPQNYAENGLLVSLHGLNRNASGYLRYSRALAERHGLLLIAPRFDRERFPTWRYQSGGIARRSAASDSVTLKVESEALWTVTLLRELVDRIRHEEGEPALPYYFIGHSAGGQLLSRLAAFAPGEARRIVIANPSTYVWPTRDVRFPFGFGGLPAPLSGDDTLRRYLAQPVTIYLGSEDIAHDAALNVSADAMRQGTNRHERGLRVFEAARTLAQKNGWPFAWRLVEAPGVGHSARAMYASPAADAALSAD
jgi:pimeloyl-ACP methyl ester carboxylesterase